MTPAGQSLLIDAPFQRDPVTVDLELSAHLELEAQILFVRLLQQSDELALVSVFRWGNGPMSRSPANSVDGMMVSHIATVRQLRNEDFASDGIGVFCIEVHCCRQK
jgi:hypothetical protein